MKVSQLFEQFVKSSNFSQGIDKVAVVLQCNIRRHEVIHGWEVAT